jgi:hypothetical protein
MRHSHGRRSRPDSLAPVNAPRWLVVRDRLSQAIACRRLEPMTDLRAELLAERARRQADGWTVEELPGTGAFFFTERDGERCCVVIEAYLPGTARLR